MFFSIEVDTVKSRWSIVNILGTTSYNYKNISYFLSLKIDFVLINSADSDKMLHDVAFHLGFRCLP